MRLEDDDPLWDESSGGDGHRGVEWDSGDSALAEAFYAALSKNTKLIFDLMIDRPGQCLDADWIAGQLPGRVGGRPPEPRRRSVSASLAATRRQHEASGRRLPFYWWAGKGGAASTYAMKPGTARLFGQARARLDSNQAGSGSQVTLIRGNQASASPIASAHGRRRYASPSYAGGYEPAASALQQPDWPAVLRTLYLIRFASAYNNTAFTGRNIAQRFYEGGEVLIRHWLCASRDVEIRRNPDLENDATDAVEFKNFAPDVVLFEGGLYSDGFNWRIASDTALDFVKSGGVIIVADADRNEISANFDSYKRDLPFFGAHLAGYPDSPLNIRYIQDISTGDGEPSSILCEPANTGPAASGNVQSEIYRIVAASPVALYPEGTALLWTNSSADVLVQNLFVDRHTKVPIATVRQPGLGYAVVIAANVTEDVTTDRNPDNIEWLYELASNLHRRAARERQLRSNTAGTRRSRDDKVDGQLSAAVTATTRGHAFISYVHEDSAKVKRLQRALQAAGVQVWLDTADLWPGQDWRTQIRRAITNDALAFIACFSQNSQARDRTYQNEELNLAIEQLRQHRPNMPWLIPVRFDNCEIPDWDVGGGRTLNSLQRADLFGEHTDRDMARLVSVIYLLLGRHN